MKKLLLQIFATKIGWAIISFILGSVFLGLNNNGVDWAIYLVYVFYGYITLLILIMCIYAWFINPARDRREWEKRNAEWEERQKPKSTNS